MVSEQPHFFFTIAFIFICVILLPDYVLHTYPIPFTLIQIVSTFKDLE